MSKRDQYGRFEKETKFDLPSAFDICSIIYKALPLILIVFILYKYLNVSSHVSKIMMEVACGLPNCTCTCPSLGITKGGL